MFLKPSATKENSDQAGKDETRNESSTQSPARSAADSSSNQHAPRAASPARVVSAARGIESLVTGGRSRSSSNEKDERKLTVGKGLSLAGEITSCDILVVEGKVEAKLSDGKLLEITEAGQFRGSVEIDNADIAGRYDGQLVVHGRLTVRSTGRISGMVKYGELEVNAGGQIIGEVQVGAGEVQKTSGGNNFKNAAAKLAFAEETDEQERKSA